MSEKFSVTLSDDTICKLDKLCDKLGLKRSAFISMLINAYVEPLISYEGGERDKQE